MTDAITGLERWATQYLRTLEPAQRRRLAAKIGAKLRRSQQDRIGAQINADGSAFEPRKTRARSRHGRIRRGAMFTKIRQGRFLRVRATADEVSVGFTGRIARIARVHQEGLSDEVSRGGPRVRYARRQLLGFTAEDMAAISAAVMDAMQSRA